MLIKLYTVHRSWVWFESVWRVWERESLWFSKWESLTLKTLLLSEDTIFSRFIIHSMKELIFSSLFIRPKLLLKNKGNAPAAHLSEYQSFHYRTVSSRTTNTCNFLCTDLEQNTSECDEWAVSSFRTIRSHFGPFKIWS